MHIYGQHNKIEYHTNIFLNEDENSRDARDWKERLLTIIQQIPETADTLKPIIQFLVTTVAPTKIYRVDNRNIKSDTTEKYIDLLLVIPNKNNIPFIELEPIIEIPYLKESRVVCSLHNEGVIKQALGNGHIFYTLNFTAENLVYDDKAVSFPATSIGAVQEMKQKAREIFSQHFERAQNFYSCAEYLHQRNPGKIIPFLLHQATEFTYRGVLMSLNGYDKRTHDIHSLKKHTRRCAPQLTTIFSPDVEEEKRLTILLEKAYLESRYENNYAVNENDLTVFFERLKLLQDSCKELVELKTDLDIS
jgi:HEPN domain-containing protein